MDIFSEETTLTNAKQYLRNNWEKGVTCVCCGQRVQLYHRKLNSGMALTLIRICNETTNGTVWIPVKEFLRQKGFKNNHDWTLLKYWGLLEEKGETEDGASSGYWRITNKGIDFVLNKIRVAKRIDIYNQKLYGHSEESTNIIESLGNKFSYSELVFNTQISELP